MSISEQFELVFSYSNYQQHSNSKKKYNLLSNKSSVTKQPSTSQRNLITHGACIDPSKSKPQDLPYFIRLVSRKQNEEISNI